jgi:hypothetical protein
MPVIIPIVLLISFIPTIVALWTGRGPWMHTSWVLSTTTTLVSFLWPSSRTFFLVPPIGPFLASWGLSWVAAWLAMRSKIRAQLL